MKTELKKIARTLNKERRAHNDNIPKEIFPIAVDMAGSYPCIEIVIRVRTQRKTLGYALKLREKGDHGWKGLYHIIGTIVRKHDTPERIFLRLEKELGIPGVISNKRLSFLTHSLRYENERNATGMATIYILDISANEAKKLKEDWRVFKKSEIQKEKIIDFHQSILLRIGVKNQSVLHFEGRF